MGYTPHIGGPSPRIPPYIVSECQFGGDNTLDNAKKFLGKKLSFFGYLCYIILDMRKIVRITESDLNRLAKKIVNEQTGTFASVFPSVNMLTTRDARTAPLMGGNNNTNIIYLTKRDAKGNPVPGTKFSYRLTGKYKFISFNIILRNVSRNAAGVLTGEVQPSNSIVKKAMQTLIGKQHLTPDGWLKIAAPANKINQALVQLHNNEGSSAELSLDGGVNITLEQV